jgi:hypothetical protein
MSFVLLDTDVSTGYATDHTDALVYYVQHYAKKKVDPKDCLMVSIDSKAMVIAIHNKEDRRGKQEVKIPFDPVLADAKEAKVRLIDMMWESVHALGMVGAFLFGVPLALIPQQ